MLVLYGTQGSGSAAAEAALDIAGLDYRKVDAASWKESPGLEELKRVNPLAQIPTLVLDDGSVLTEVAAILIHLGLAHPQSGLVASRSVAARAADPRPGLHRRELLRRHRHPRLSGPLVSRSRRRRQEGDAGARPGPPARALGDLRRPVPGHALALGRAPRRARHPRRHGLDVERRAQGAGAVAAGVLGAARRASRPIRASPRSGRGTGRSAERDARGDARGASPAGLLAASLAAAASPTVARADAAAELVEPDQRLPPRAAAVRRPAPADGAAARAFRSRSPASRRRLGRARRGAERERLSGGGGNVDPRWSGPADPARGVPLRRRAPLRRAARSALLADRRLAHGRQHLADQPRQAAPAADLGDWRRAGQSDPGAGQRGAGAAAAVRRRALRRRRAAGLERGARRGRARAQPRHGRARLLQPCRSRGPVGRRSARPPPAIAGGTSARTSPPGLGEPAGVVAGWLASPGTAPTSCRRTSPRWARPSRCAPAPRRGIWWTQTFGRR